jgi:hypothetical protein
MMARDQVIYETILLEEIVVAQILPTINKMVATKQINVQYKPGITLQGNV